MSGCNALAHAYTAPSSNVRPTPVNGRPTCEECHGERERAENTEYRKEDRERASEKRERPPHVYSVELSMQPRTQAVQERKHAKHHRVAFYFSVCVHSAASTRAQHRRRSKREILKRDESDWSPKQRLPPSLPMPRPSWLLARCRWVPDSQTRSVWLAPAAQRAQGTHPPAGQRGQPADSVIS